MNPTEIATEVVSNYNNQLHEAFKNGLDSGVDDGFSFAFYAFTQPESLKYIALLIVICIAFKMLDKIVKKHRNRS